MAALNALKELPGDEPAKKKTSSSSINIEKDRKALASKRTESDPFLGSTVQGGPPPIGNLQGHLGTSATSSKNGKLGADTMVSYSPEKKAFWKREHNVRCEPIHQRDAGSEPRQQPRVLQQTPIKNRIPRRGCQRKSQTERRSHPQ